MLVTIPALPTTGVHHHGARRAAGLAVASAGRARGRVQCMRRAAAADAARTRVVQWQFARAVGGARGRAAMQAGMATSYDVDALASWALQCMQVASQWICMKGNRADLGALCRDVFACIWWGGLGLRPIVHAAVVKGPNLAILPVTSSTITSIPFRSCMAELLWRRSAALMTAE